MFLGVEMRFNLSTDQSNLYGESGEFIRELRGNDEAQFYLPSEAQGDPVLVFNDVGGVPAPQGGARDDKQLCSAALRTKHFGVSKRRHVAPVLD